MQPTTESGMIAGSEAHNSLPVAVGSQPWWCGVSYGPGGSSSSDGLENTCKISPLNTSCGHDNGKNDSPLPPVISTDDGDTRSKEMREMEKEAGSNGASEPGSQQTQPSRCAIPPMLPEYYVPHTQLELGYSVACAPYPYPDPYFGGVMAAYGNQTLAPPQFIGMPQNRMALPLELTEEPVYVNAKQYHGILRRRQSRAKAELEKKLIKVRKPYLHESRHRHAMRRARGCGGRFLNTKKTEGNTNNSSDKGNTVQSASSYGSENGRCNGSKIPDTGTNAQESATKDVTETYATRNGGFQQCTGFQFSTFHPVSGDRGEDKDCSGQQRNDILAKGCRTVTIQ